MGLRAQGTGLRAQGEERHAASGTRRGEDEGVNGRKGDEETERRWEE